MNPSGNEYVEFREGGYYLAGTRIGLDVLVHSFRLGRSPEAVLQSYPSIGSLAKVYGAIAFMLENPGLVATYLSDQDALWDQLRETHALPPDARERFQRAREEVTPKPA